MDKNTVRLREAVTATIARPWARAKRFVRRPQGSRRALLISVAVLLALVLPSAFAVSSALADYSQLRTLGISGMHHLLVAKNDLLPSSGTSSSATTCTAATATATPARASTPASSSATLLSSFHLPSSAAVRSAQTEFQAARRDFQTVQTRLDHPDMVVSAAGSFSNTSSTLATAHAVANAGYDVATLGADATTALVPLVTRLQGGALNSSTELLTPADLSALQRVAAQAQPLLADIQMQAAHIDLAALPLCPAQRTELASLITQLPRIRGLAADAGQLLPEAGWALGVGQPRHFLVQTLDRAELRPSGGFAGDYGILTIQNGKILPFSLTDVDRIDYATGFSWTDGRRPPAPYSTWWPFANWGLRDANLAADFPTNARMVMDVYRNEGGGNVDGVINFTPVAIEHVLGVTGPLVIPLYGETITSANLEDRLHYYQQDPAGIAKEQALSPNDTSTSPRKRFTQLVGQLLQDRVRHLPLSQLLPLAQQMLKDMQSKDIEVYVTDPKIEARLTEHDASGALDTTAGVDGFTLVQANVSVAKSTPFVGLTESDDVTLDAKGGATHNLTLSFNYRPTSDVYGYPTYRDYLRAYVPPGAQLLAGDGFDTDTPLCWTAPQSDPKATKPKQFEKVPDCTPNPYPGGELTCPTGYYGPGTQAPSVFGSDGKTPWPLDVLGAPTQTTSDTPGRAMFGGYLVIPPFCSATVTLSWYVPNVAAPSSAVPATARPYTILVQRQSGTFYQVRLTVHPAPGVSGEGSKPVHYDATISTNLAFTLGKPSPAP